MSLSAQTIAAKQKDMIRSIGPGMPVSAIGSSPIPNMAKHSTMAPPRADALPSPSHFFLAVAMRPY